MELTGDKLPTYYDIDLQLLNSSLVNRPYDCFS
jgi:hypothetical protein